MDDILVFRIIYLATFAHCENMGDGLAEKNVPRRLSVVLILVLISSIETEKLLAAFCCYYF